jgi:hypothetical protein
MYVPCFVVENRFTRYFGKLNIVAKLIEEGKNLKQR